MDDRTDWRRVRLGLALWATACIAAYCLFLTPG